MVLSLMKWKSFLQNLISFNRFVNSPGGIAIIRDEEVTVCAPYITYINIYKYIIYTYIWFLLADQVCKTYKTMHQWKIATNLLEWYLESTSEWDGALPAPFSFSLLSASIGLGMFNTEPLRNISFLYMGLLKSSIISDAFRCGDLIKTLEWRRGVCLLVGGRSISLDFVIFLKA